MKIIIEAEAKKTASRKQEAVGMTLSDLFEKCGCSTESVARVMEVADSLVSKWADGVETPNTMQCIKLARHMGCSLYTLYLAILSTPIKE